MDSPERHQLTPFPQSAALRIRLPATDRPPPKPRQFHFCILATIMGAGERERARWDVAILYALAVAGYALVAGLPLLFGTDSRATAVPFRAIVLALSLWALFRSVARKELY